LIYGLTLALLVILLRFLEYRYLLRDLSIEIYVSIIAILFTGLGIWIAFKIINRKSYAISGAIELFEVNHKNAIDFKISEREIEVLHLLAQGYSNQEIANKLFLSLNTVKTHTSNLYSKLNVSRRTAAIKKARELKLIP
jgi:DNA-binding NarL/FixJ family response regulator